MKWSKSAFKNSKKELDVVAVVNVYGIVPHMDNKKEKKSTVLAFIDGRINKETKSLAYTNASAAIDEVYEKVVSEHSNEDRVYVIYTDINGNAYTETYDDVYSLVNGASNKGYINAIMLHFLPSYSASLFETISALNMESSFCNSKTFRYGSKYKLSLKLLDTNDNFFGNKSPDAKDSVINDFNKIKRFFGNVLVGEVYKGRQSFTTSVTRGNEYRDIDIFFDKITDINLLKLVRLECKWRPIVHVSIKGLEA